ncbi:ABC transporter permease, partial [Coprococcus sp. MSK.21.13]|nr:ABC transporter permease [Coprococcus sp. MSK.21.13]
MDILINVLEQGLIFSIVSLGVYISYKILDFPDLSADGTFPLGAAVTAALIVKGVNPFIACIV